MTIFIYFHIYIYKYDKLLLLHSSAKPGVLVFWYLFDISKDKKEGVLVLFVVHGGVRGNGRMALRFGVCDGFYFVLMYILFYLFYFIFFYVKHFALPEGMKSAL